MDTAHRVRLHYFVFVCLFCFVLFLFFVFFNKSTPRDIRIKGTPRMTPTKYTFYHILFAVNHTFQYKVLNSILYTNTKLYQLYTDDKCSFWKFYPEIPSHLFVDSIYSQIFLEILWTLFSFYFRRTCFPYLKGGHNSRFKTSLSKSHVTDSDIISMGLQKDKHATRNSWFKA